LNAYGTKLQNAIEVVNFLHSNLFDHLESSYTRRKRPLHKVFWHVDENDVDRSSPMFACDRVEGTQNIHCISATNKIMLT
jgi:hypothetical protein